MPKLVPGKPEYAELFHSWRQSPATRAANPLKDETVEDVRHNLLDSGFDTADHSFELYRFFLDIEGKIVAHASLKSCMWDQGYGEIGYGVAPELFNRGYGGLVAKLAIEKIFRETDLVRLFATVSVSNSASAKILKKLGFTQEGCLREHFLILGNRVDQYYFGLLRREWEASQG